jgi:[ribosomal protein S5]-alanine N-acetyltransferase
MNSSNLRAGRDFPALETERLILRPISWVDREFIFRHFSDPRLNRYLLDEPPVTSPTEADQIIADYLDPARASLNRWVLLNRHTQEPVGTCGYHLWNQQHQRAEIGYDLSPDWWGKGLMFEALSAVLTFGFGVLSLNRVQAIVHPENEASSRLLVKLGFRLEGILRAYYFNQGEYYDHNLFSLLRQDWVK